MRKFLLSSLLTVLVSLIYAQKGQTIQAPGCNPGPITQVASLPYSSGAQTTCGDGDDVTATNVNNVCGSTLYYGGEDEVYTFTPTATGLVGINVGGSGSWMGITLYQGCPMSAAGTCVGNSQSSLGSQSLCVTVTAGQVYYLIVDSWPPPTCNAYSLTISGCSGAPAAGTAVATPSVRCATFTTNLSLTGSAVNCGITYQWQSGPSSTGPWTNIAGATAATATANVTGLTFYRCVLACGASTAASSPATASVAPSPGGCGICGVTSITIPYSATGLSTCGSDDVTSTNVANICGSSLYYGGEDAVYSFTPSSNTTVGIDVTGTGSWMGIMLYAGCPLTGTCAGSAQSSLGSQSLCVSVVAGQAYYLVIDSWPSPTCNPYNINIYSCSGAPPAGTAVASPTAACASGGTVALSVSGGPGSCGYSFQWESAPVSTGPWSSVAGATAANYTPAITGTICYRRLTTCGVSTATSSAVCVSVGTCSNALGTGLVSVPSLPYSTSGTTCGSVNDLTFSNVNVSGCSSSSYFTGEDQVFMFTPTTSGNITINLTSAGSNTGLMLYNSCPLTCGGSTGCFATSQSAAGSKTLVACVNAGTTYYLVLDSWSTPSCNAYSNLSISAPGAVTVATNNDPCVNPQPLTAGGSFTGTTLNYTPDTPGNLTSVFCGSIENNQWFTFTATSSSATFSISAVGGASCSAGIQAQIFNVNTSGGVCNTCNSFTSMSTPCYNPATTASGSVTATGLTVGQTYYLMIDGNGGALCNFTIGGWSFGSVLPVDLINFSGDNYNESSNKLVWKVAQETEMKKYVVQRSVDAIDYYDIGEVMSTNSTSDHSYTFYDKQIEPRLYYYQLRMINSGNIIHKYSNVIAVNNDPKVKFKLDKVFPNPTRSRIYVSMEIPASGIVQLEILDPLGHPVGRSETAVSYGRRILEADTESLSKGIYYIKITYNGEVHAEKFSVQ